LVEKAGFKMEDTPKTWDAFYDFFKDVQKQLRAQGVRNVYGLGFQVTTNGVDPDALYNSFLLAYGGQGIVTKDAKLHLDDPQVREAAIKALTYPAIAYKVNSEWLKTGLGRNIPCMPSIAQDPWWREDPHREAYVQQGLLGPTVPPFWTFNPAYAQVQNEHVWPTAWADIVTGGMTPQAAADKAFKRVEEIPDRSRLRRGVGDNSQNASATTLRRQQRRRGR
jgi:ABC-type glycerol-3-phosphate transport system substrate-binding protein